MRALAKSKYTSNSSIYFFLSFSNSILVPKIFFKIIKVKKSRKSKNISIQETEIVTSPKVLPFAVADTPEVNIIIKSISKTDLLVGTHRERQCFINNVIVPVLFDTGSPTSLVSEDSVLNNG